MARGSALIACVDTLSLALCGELKAPLSVEAPRSGSEMQSQPLVEKTGETFRFALSPWPFRGSALTIEGEGLALPEGGRLADEPSMRQWLKTGVRLPFVARLSPNQGLIGFPELSDPRAAPIGNPFVVVR